MLCRLRSMQLGWQPNSIKRNFHVLLCFVCFVRVWVSSVWVHEARSYVAEIIFPRRKTKTPVELLRLLLWWAAYKISLYECHVCVYICAQLYHLISAHTQIALHEFVWMLRIIEQGDIYAGRNANKNRKSFQTKIAAAVNICIDPKISMYSVWIVRKRK